MGMTKSGAHSARGRRSAPWMPRRVPSAAAAPARTKGSGEDPGRTRSAKGRARNHFLDGVVFCKWEDPHARRRTKRPEELEVKRMGE